MQSPRARIEKYYLKNRGVDTTRGACLDRYCMSPRAAIFSGGGKFIYRVTAMLLISQYVEKANDFFLGNTILFPKF